MLAGAVGFAVDLACKRSGATHYTVKIDLPVSEQSVSKQKCFFCLYGFLCLSDEGLLQQLGGFFLTWAVDYEHCIVFFPMVDN